MKYDPKTASVTTWLEFLRPVLPPYAVLLVGAGTGTDSIVQLLGQWDQPDVILVEGDKSQYLHLKRNLQSYDRWRLHNLLLAPTPEKKTFYRASNPAESGLIEPEQLLSLWPNLHTCQRCSEQPAVTLADVLSETETVINWLILDCMPAGDLLRSAESRLDQIDLLVLRIPFEDSLSTILGDGHKKMQAWLEEKGFRFLVAQPERHPALARVLYVRDSRHQSAVCLEQKSRIECLMKIKDELEKSVSMLKNERDEQMKVAEQVRQQLDVLMLTNEQLEQQKSVLLARVGEKDAELQQHKSECAGVAQRQQLMQDELNKAETQIDLIRELLLQG